MSGIPAGTIDALIGTLRAGKADGYEWVSTPFFLDLALLFLDLALRKTADA
jgi:hypothetical protein